MQNNQEPFEIDQELSFYEGSVFHSRQNPRRNQFNYPVFFMTIPIHLELKSNSNLFSFHRWNLFSFSSADYLDGKNEDIKTSLLTFLKSQNINWIPDQIWLHTSPRILGYVFNPISFWYLSLGGQLKAVLCEVNNTFSERHFYWVDLPYQKQKLAKEFHVSPFFHIQGFYQFSFQITKEKIRCDIDYFQKENQLLLKTSVQGKLNKKTSPVKLFLKYGWMTVLVVARIHYQALKIYLKKIPYVSKPPPPKEKTTFPS